MILLALDWGLLGEKLTLVVIIVSVSLVIAMKPMPSVRLQLLYRIGLAPTAQALLVFCNPWPMG